MVIRKLPEGKGHTGVRGRVNCPATEEGGAETREWSFVEKDGSAPPPESETVNELAFFDAAKPDRKASSQSPTRSHTCLYEVSLRKAR